MTSDDLARETALIHPNLCGEPGVRLFAWVVLGDWHDDLGTLSEEELAYLAATARDIRAGGDPMLWVRKWDDSGRSA